MSRYRLSCDAAGLIARRSDAGKIADPRTNGFPAMPKEAIRANVCSPARAAIARLRDAGLVSPTRTSFTAINDIWPTNPARIALRFATNEFSVPKRTARRSRAGLDAKRRTAPSISTTQSGMCNLLIFIKNQKRTLVAGRYLRPRCAVCFSSQSRRAFAHRIAQKEQIGESQWVVFSLLVSVMRHVTLVAVVGSVISGILGVHANASDPVVVAADTLSAAAAKAQNTAGPQNTTGTLRDGSARQIRANGAPIILEIRKGTLVHLAAPAATVFIADPDIADIQVKSPTLIYISAKAPGETVLYAVDDSDHVLLNSPIRVELDVSALRSSLKQLVPGERVSAASVNGNVVLTGIVSDAGRAEKVRALAASIAGEFKGGQVIDRMTIATPNQVNLQVRVAEVDVMKLNEIGVNWAKAVNDLNSSVAFQTNNPVTTGAELTNQLRVGRMVGQAASAMISALEQEGFITDLAEPNLTAMSGQTASFLAGGEFPVPIPTTSGNGFPTFSVEFKSFGVSLAFTPTILDPQHLNLRVRPEVSELTTTGEVSVPITSTATVTIPALTVRRAETSIEIASGESFMLAGLLHHTSQQLVSKVPWIGDIPILGSLFRSDRFQRGETDLVVIVTPYLVRPAQTHLAAPTDGLRLPNDAQRVLFSDKYRQGLPAAGRGPLGAGGHGLIGPGGFRLD